jgi:hypothetical protein
MIASIPAPAITARCAKFHITYLLVECFELSLCLCQFAAQAVDRGLVRDVLAGVCALAYAAAGLVLATGGSASRVSIPRSDLVRRRLRSPRLSSVLTVRLGEAKTVGQRT